MRNVSSPITSPLPSAAPAAARPEAAQGPRAAAPTAPLDWTDKLAIGNREAARALRDQAAEALSNPLSLLKRRVEGLIEGIAHPLAPIEQAIEATRQDGLHGTLQLAQAASGAVAVGTLVAGAVALVAAPFTGGASLAALPAIGAVAEAAGLVGLASTGASLVAHEVGMATADSASELSAHAHGAAGALGTLGEAALTYGAGRVVRGLSTGEVTFKWLADNDASKLWSKDLAPRTRSALAAFEKGEVGASVRGLDLRNRPLSSIHADLKARGFQVEQATITDFKTRQPVIHPRSGQPVPMEIWTHPDGGMVRIKPQGDPTSKFRPQPHASASVNFPPGSSARDFNNEAFKLDHRGTPLPKWAKDAAVPFGDQTRDAKRFLDALASRTHVDLAVTHAD